MSVIHVWHYYIECPRQVYLADTNFLYGPVWHIKQCQLYDTVRHTWLTLGPLSGYLYFRFGEQCYFATLGFLGKWNLGSLLFYEICGYPNHWKYWNHWNYSQFSGAIVIKAIRVLKQDIKAARWKLITEKKHGQKKCYWIFIAWHFEVLFDWGKYVFRKIVVVLSAVSRWGSPFGYL